MQKIYLDSAATTPVAEEVLEAMKPFFSHKFGNSSSIHSFGREANEALEKSRETILKKLNAKEHKLAFTSGGTESNNWALKGIAFANKEKGKHIITTRIEHDCILNSCKWLQKQGFEVTYLPVDKEGFVEVETLKSAMKKETILVSIIHGNNEIGTIQNLEEIGKICKEKNVYFHTDACQSFTKVPIDLKKLNVDLVTINAHKIYGPKGVGGLLIKTGVRIDTFLHGGGQESGYRSGTVNVSGIVGFAKAAEIIKEKDIKHMEGLRDFMIKNIPEEIRESKLNGPTKKRLCNNANFSFKFVEGEALLLHLDANGIAASTGSACSSKSLEPSHVLTAIGLSPVDAHGTIRFSLGKDTKKEETEHTVKVLKESVEILRKISPIKG